MVLWIEECVLCSDKGEEIYIHIYPNHILPFASCIFLVHTQILYKSGIVLVRLS